MHSRSALSPRCPATPTSAINSTPAPNAPAVTTASRATGKSDVPAVTTRTFPTGAGRFGVAGNQNVRATRSWVAAGK